MMTTLFSRRTLLNTTIGLAAFALPSTSHAQPPQEGFFMLANATGDGITFLKDDTAEYIQAVTSPWGVAVGPDGFAFVSAAQSMLIVDTQSLLPVAEIPSRVLIEVAGYGEYRSGGMGIAVTPDGSTVAMGVQINGASGLVEIFNVARGAFVSTIPVGIRPFDVVASPDSTTIYSIDHDSFTITAIDLETTGTTTIDAAPLGYGEFDKPHYAAARSDGALLLPYSGQLLWILNPLTGESTSLPMTSNAHQHGITLSADELTAYIVGTGPAGPSDGPPNLTILDLATGAERIIELTRPHEQVALTEDGLTAILTGGYTFADGGWDGVTVVDLATGEATEIDIPGQPLGIARIN